LQRKLRQSASTHTASPLLTAIVCFLALFVAELTSYAARSENRCLRVAPLTSATSGPSLPPQDSAAKHLNAARDYLDRARKNLNEASNQSSAAMLDAARPEFKQAAEEFRAYMTQQVEPNERPNQLERTIAGLMECGYSFEALELIFQHPEMQGDPTILHLKADILFALGQREAAAKAYEKWVSEGKCRGSYNYWYGSLNLKNTHGDPLLYLAPKKALNIPCSALPPRHTKSGIPPSEQPPAQELWHCSRQLLATVNWATLTNRRAFYRLRCAWIMPACSPLCCESC